MRSGPISMDTDVLVTHMLPPLHLDIAGFGDANLLGDMWRTRPRLHVFGHVHGGCGKDDLVYDRFEAWHEDICRGIRCFSTLEKCFVVQSNIFGAQKQRRVLILSTQLQSWG